MFKGNDFKSFLPYKCKSQIPFYDGETQDKEAKALQNDSKMVFTGDKVAHLWIFFTKRHAFFSLVAGVHS